MKSPEFIGMALGIVSPWKVKEVRFSKKYNRLAIYADFDQGTAYSCPFCETRTKLHRIKNKTWQNTNYMGYVAYLHAEVPSFICPLFGCGIFPFYPTWDCKEDWEICSTVPSRKHRRNPKFEEWLSNSGIEYDLTL